MCVRSTYCMLCETFCHVEDNILSETCTCACRVDRAKEAIIIACHPQINLFIFLFSWFQCNMCLHYCCFVIHCALSIYVYECVRRRLFSYSCCFDICRSYRMLTQSLDVYYTIQDQHSLLRYVFGLLRKPVWYSYQNTAQYTLSIKERNSCDILKHSAAVTWIAEPWVQQHIFSIISFPSLLQNNWKWSSHR